MPEGHDDDNQDSGEHDQQPSDRHPPEQPQDEPQGGGQNRQQGGQPTDRQPRSGQQGGQPGRQPQDGGGGQQGGRPQGGQPQGGQPQGGAGGQQGRRQQGGQPQGGRPGQPQAGASPGTPAANQQGGQPQAGQPRRGQPQGRQVQTGLDIDTAYLQEWAVYITALFGVGGLGLGVLWILVDAVDLSIFEVDNLSGVGSAFSATSILITMLIILSVAAVFLGAWFGRKLEEPDRESFVIAGASVAAGASVFFLLVSLLLSVGLDGLSIDIGGVIINLILTALFVGATAAGGAAVTRNLAPRDL